MKKAMKAIVAVAALAFAAMTAQAATRQVGSYTWTYTLKTIDGITGAAIENGGACAVSPEPTGALTITSQLDGYPVIEIGEKAFCDCGSLTSVTLPDSIMAIGSGAFQLCSSLKAASLPGRLVGEIDTDDVFAGCSPDIVITYRDPQFTIDNGVLTKVVPNGNDSVTIPSTVTSIARDAFKNLRNVTSVTIPASVTSIEKHVFDGCRGLKSFIVARNNPNYMCLNDLLLTKDGTTLVQGVNGSVTIPACVTTIDEYAFHSCSELMDVTIPDSVTSIGYGAFAECQYLTSVTIPGSVTSIGSHAFTICTGLTSVTIGNGVTSIGPWAFQYCSGLTSVTIPDSVTDIGQSAFQDCSGLVRASLPHQFDGALDETVFLCCSPDLVITYRAAPTLTIGGGKTSMSRAYSCEAKSGESFSVACSGSWTATASASWITITSGASGSGKGKVVYNLAENTGTTKREGTIKVTCGTVTRTCTITQDKPLLIGGKTEMARTYDAAKHADCYFSVSCSLSSWTAASSASWVALHSDSKSGTGTGMINYDIAANTSSSVRTATIKVTSRGLTRICTITQKAGAATLTIGGGKESMSRAYSCEAKPSESFSVACNSSWTATASASWITITSGASGSGDGKVVYKLAENTGTTKRYGTIKVKCGSITRTCTITQDKPLLIGGKTSMSRAYSAAKQTGCYFTVTCSQALWKAESSASWVMLKTTSGTGTAKLTYDIAANKSTSARIATIKVTSRGLTRTCTIKQSGK